jgi:hypothetical protein
MNELTKLHDKAMEVFYSWEEKSYPKGDTPFSDADRLMFMAGWVQGYRFLNDGGQDD